LVRFEGFLKNFVEKHSEGLRSLECGNDFDPILKDSSSLAVYRICYDGSGNEMVGMKNDHVVQIIHNTLAGCVEIPDQVDIRVLAAGSVKP
jgi:hypothetical protein